MAHQPKYYMVIWYECPELHFFCPIICMLVRWNIIWYMTLDRYKDTIYFEILWDVRTLTCWYFKTTEPILMKFTGYNEWTHRALYTNFQSNLKFCKNIEIFLKNSSNLWNSTLVLVEDYLSSTTVDFIRSDWKLKTKCLY